MYSQAKVVTLFILFLFSCGEKDEFNVPGNNGSHDQNHSSNDIDCPISWEQSNGVWIDPNLCAAWSSKSDPLTWSEAASFCSSLTEGNIEYWSIPSLSDLEDMSIRNPPFEDKDGDLWSTEEDPNSGLIWTVNLAQPGMTILLESSSQAHVRCIAK